MRRCGFAKWVKERLKGSRNTGWKRRQVEREALDWCFYLTSEVSQTVLTILSKSRVELRPALSVLLMTLPVVPLFEQLCSDLAGHLFLYWLPAWLGEIIALEQLKGCQQCTTAMAALRKNKNLQLFVQQIILKFTASGVFSFLSIGSCWASFQSGSLQDPRIF